MASKTKSSGWGMGLALLCCFALILALGWVGRNVGQPAVRQTTVGLGSGATPAAVAFVDDFFAPGGYYGTAVMAESANQVVSASYDAVTSDLYLFDADFSDRGQMRCAILDTRVGDFGGSGGGCPVDGQTNPWVGGSFGGDWSQTYVAWADDTAETMIVTLTTGERVQANVVNGHAIAIWPTKLARLTGWNYATEVELVDADGAVIWSKSLEPIPVPPNVEPVADLG